MALALCTSAGLASGQTAFKWAAPVDGSWLDASKWAPAQLPDAPQHEVMLGFVAPYTVTISGGSIIELVKLEIPNPNVTLRVNASTAWPLTLLQMGSGGILNNGTIVLEGGGTSVKGSELIFAHDGEISGSGRIHLLGKNASMRSYTGATFRIGPDQVITGQGTVKNIINEGVIHASEPGAQLTVEAINTGLILVDQPEAVLDLGVINHGTIRVENGSRVVGGASTSVGEQGSLRLTGAGTSSRAHLINSVVETSGTELGILGGSLADCRVDVHARIQSVEVRGTLGNGGTIDLHGLMSLRSPWQGGNTTRFSGPGTLRMMSTAAEIRHADSVDAFNGSDHVIRGSGTIAGKDIYLPFINDGTISCDVPGSWMKMWNVENRGLIEAVNGATLQAASVNDFARPIANTAAILAHAGSTIKNLYVNQSGAGVVRADGGTLDGVIVNGGRLEAINGGIIRNGSAAMATIDGDVIASGTFSASRTVTTSSTIRVKAGGRLSAYGNIVPTLLTGEATVLLEDRATATITGGGLHPTTFDVGVSIIGSGRLLNSYNQQFLLDGTLSPGTDEDHVGQIELAQVRLGSTARASIDLRSKTSFDSLVASALVSIAGTLKVRHVDGYVPAPCSEHVIITATETGVIEGNFDTLDLPEVPLGRMNVRYDPGAVILVYNPADHDGSTFVDTDDFTAFVMDFEAGGDAADFNHSGFVDGDDFTDFLTAFEQGC